MNDEGRPNGGAASETTTKKSDASLSHEGDVPTGPGAPMTAHTPATVVENAGLVSGSAEARRDEIKSTLHSMVDLKERVLELITEAQAADDHLTLGYPSWLAYVAAEFVGLLDELDREDRRIATFALAKTGMSSRAIAPIVGVSDRQVRTDLAQVGRDFPPEPDVNAVNAEQPRASSAHSWKFQRQQGDGAATPTSSTGLHLVTGLDGKAYPRPEPKPKPKPKRRPLPTAWRDALYELQSNANRLVRLADDDRFPAHRAGLGGLGGLGELARISETLEEARQALAAEGGPSSSEHLSTPQPPKYGGSRRKHAQQLEALVTMLSGAATAFEEVTVLDASVTKEEAIRLRADLALQIQALGRLDHLLEERSR